jgi:hypothetical protein
MKEQKNAFNNWKCTICGSIFRTRRLMQAHRKEKHYNERLNQSNIQIKTRDTYFCEFCNKKWITTKSGFSLHRKFCKMNPNAEKFIGHKQSEETRLLWKLNKRIGGFRKNAGIGIKGYYKGLYCMSSWELAWVVYQLEHGKNVQQCTETFEYTMNGEVHHYTPDFKIDDIYFEIKNWHRPDTDFKINAFPKEKKLVLIEGKDNEVYIKYVKEKYGNEFWNILYEKDFKKKKKIEKREKLIKQGYKVDSLGRVSTRAPIESDWIKRKELILNCGIDLMKFGWVEKVIKLTGLSKRVVYNTVLHFNLKVFKKKNKN